MREFFEEFSYMCSSANTKSRGLYIFIAIAMIALLIGVVVGVVLMVVNGVKYHTINGLSIALTIGCVAALIGVFIWLKKS